jgi:ABC-2 type transport system permease protein
MMNKAWIIAWKDTRIRLNDRSALVFTLLTPLLLTFLMGQVFGRQEENSDFSIPAVPVAVVNQDDGRFATTLMEILTTNETVTSLLAVTVVEDPAPVRTQIEAGQGYCCLVMIPAGFSEGVANGEPITIEMLYDPAATISPLLVRGVLEQITGQMVGRSDAVAVIINQLVASGRITDAQEGTRIGTEIAESDALNNPVTLRLLTPEGETQRFNPLAYLAPGMAILFLSLSAAQGTRSILREQQSGTLARLNSTPTSPFAIVGGKILGVAFFGLLQFGVLLLGAVVLFGVRWRDPLAVILLSLLLVLAFTALGLMIASLARTEGEAALYGTVGSVIFSVLGGGVGFRGDYPPFLQTLGLITPNAWGMDAFTKLGFGGGLVEILPQLAGLLVLTAIAFGVSVFGYQRSMAKQ